MWPASTLLLHFFFACSGYYFLVEKSVARRIIFEDHVDQYRKAASQSEADPILEVCRLAYPYRGKKDKNTKKSPDPEFLDVPYGMIVAKGDVELKTALDNA